MCPWYKGLSLLEQLDKLKISGRDSSAPVVMPVLDRYTDRGLVRPSPHCTRLPSAPHTVGALDSCCVRIFTLAWYCCV